jgi:hypothetical protein
MVYTFKELRDQVLRIVGEDGDTVTETMVKDLMNQAHMNRVTQHSWPFMRWGRTETITVVSGTRDYALHQEFGKGIDFFNSTAGRGMVELPYREELLVVEEADDATGSALEFQIAGTQPVKQQLTANSIVKIVSTSAADNTAAVAIIITGEDADGDVVTESITPNGVTAVSGTTTFRTILGVTKTADTTGTMTLKDASDTALLALAPTENGKTYRVLRLMRTPDGGYTLKYRFQMKPRELVNDFDIPQLPDQHAQILVFDTLLLMSGAMRTVTSSQMQQWQEVQARLERNLYREYGFDQTTLNAAPTYIRWTGDY